MNREHQLWDSLHTLRPLFDDPGVSEILVVGPSKTWAESAGVLAAAPQVFGDAFSLECAARAIARWVGRRLDAGHPLLDGRLPDGSRVQVTLPPASQDGICLSIRKPSAVRWTLERFVETAALTPACAEFLRQQVEGGANLLVSGGTGSGKTSLLSVLAGLSGPAERVLVLEDSTELDLPLPHVVRLQAVQPLRDGQEAVTLGDLLVAALRMRPDRIVVGEVRGAEAITLVQAMNTGHRGCMGTVHAGGPAEALSRLEALCLQGGLALPPQLLETQICSGLDGIVHCHRFPTGRRAITAVCRLGTGGPEEVFRWRGGPEGGLVPVNSLRGVA